MDEPLLSNTGTTDDSLSKAGDLSKLQPCANFLLKSQKDAWYHGKIHKQIASESNVFKKIRQAYRNLNDEKYTIFVSYKFSQTIDGRDRTFCVTFRKKRNADFDNVMGFSDDYLIRVSLIEEDTSSNQQQRKDSKQASRILHMDDETPITCRGRESLVIQIDSLHGGNVILPKNLEEAHFSSITSGDTPDQIAVVRDMTEIDIKTEENKKFLNFYDTYISPNMKTLGSILVNHCDNRNSSPVSSNDGGATRRHTRLTRRRKGVFKRKGKKSYKKKKYGKTKKSRRFRRSGRSRR